MSDALLLEAAQGAPDAQRAAIPRLWRRAEQGQLAWGAAEYAALMAVQLHGADGAIAWQLAGLQLPHDPSHFQTLAARHLGEVPPLGLQRHLLAHRAGPRAKAGLVALYEACSEVQRRGLLQAIDAPLAPDWWPAIQAVAAQATPQTAAEALAALGRVGDRTILGPLYQLGAARPELTAAAQAAVRALQARVPPGPQATAGGLAVTPEAVGALSVAGGDAPPPSAVLEMGLAVDEAFDKLAPAPRRVPLGLRLALWITAGTPWTLLTSGGAAWVVYTWAVKRAPGDGWPWVLGTVLGIQAGIHLVSAPGRTLALLRHGRTAQARERQSWVTYAGQKRTPVHHYRLHFVAEDGARHAADVAFDSPQPRLEDDQAEGILYLPGPDGAVGRAQPIDTLPTVRVSPAGRLRLRWGPALWTVGVVAPWLYVLGAALGWLG